MGQSQDVLVSSCKHVSHSNRLCCTLHDIVNQIEVGISFYVLNMMYKNDTNEKYQYFVSLFYLMTP